MIRLRTLGQSTIQIDGVRVGPDAEIVFATLVFLAIERGRRVGRGELLGMLWPDAPAARASHCLRQTIYRLRTLGAELDVDRTHIGLGTTAVDCDVDAVLHARSDDVERLAERIEGSFLPGYTPEFSERFRDWVERQRDLVTSAARRVLVGAINARKTRGEWPEVERLAHRCLSLDPLNEDATLALAEAAALHGAKAQAMSILDGYLREMGPSARELRVPAMALRRRIAEPELEFPLPPPVHVPFVGRSAEMAILGSALRSARGGVGSLHFIHGEPGIGKTRLLSEFTRAALLEGVRVAPTLCQSSDGRRPLSAFVDVVPKLMALPGALGCSPNSHSYLRRLVEHHSSDAPPTPDTTEAVALYANVRRSLFDLFDAIASESPLVVTIEDVHWLDTASWEIIAEAVCWIQTRRMMLILTSREPEPRYPTAGASSPEGPHSLWVGPLDHAARTALVEATLSQEASRAFGTWCVDMSGGNPFYLHELALHGLAAGGQYRVPPSLIALVNQRIARLSPASCRVLQVCAILGKNSTLERVEKVVGEPRTAMLDALDELESRGLIQWDGVCVRCNHDLLSHAALARASDLCRRTLHFHAARCFEETFLEDSSAATAWNAAEHWIAAGEPARAIKQLRNCAAHALEVGRPAEACETLQTCLTISMSSERIDTQRQLLRALRIADRNVDAIDVLTELVHVQAFDASLTRHTDDELELIMAKWAIGTELPSLVTALEGCSRCRSASVTHRLRAARYGFMLADNMCSPEPAHRIYEAVSPDLASATSPDAEKWYCEMVYHTAFADVSTAARFARKLLSIESQLGDQRDAYLAHVHVANVLAVAGECEESIAILEAVHQSSVEAKLYWIACLTARTLAWQKVEVGSVGEARHWSDLALAYSSKIQHRGSVADSLAVSAEVALAEGRYAEASELIGRSGASWGPSHHARADARALGLQCAVWLAQGTPEKCHAVIHDLDAAHHRTCRHAAQDVFTARCARVHEALGDIPQARGAIERYLPYRRNKGPLMPELRDTAQRLGVACVPDASHATPLQPS